MILRPNQKILKEVEDKESAFEEFESFTKIFESFSFLKRRLDQEKNLHYINKNNLRFFSFENDYSARIGVSLTAKLSSNKKWKVEIVYWRGYNLEKIMKYLSQEHKKELLFNLDLFV